MLEATKFHNRQNHYYTKALFYDLSGSNKSKALYTLKDHDVGPFISLRNLYMDTNDLTEYAFANTYFANWEHWEQICQCAWFKPHIRKWRKELKTKLESMVLQAVLEEAKDPKSKNRFSANKLIYDRLQKSHIIRGRPSKEEVEGELKRQTHAERQLQEDLKRITGDQGNGNT